MVMCFNPYINDSKLNNDMKFDDLLKFEGFDSMQTQDAQTGNSDQYQKGLTPDQYRSTAASEYEEEKPYSREKNKLKSVIERCKTFKNGMNQADVSKISSDLAAIFNEMN